MTEEPESYTVDGKVELLPCPFCGGKAEIARLGTVRFSTKYACTECSCTLETGETFNYGHDWNIRATVI